MSRSLSILVVVGATVLGAFLGGFLTAQMWERELDSWHIIAAQGQVYVAREILHGHGTEVAKRTLNSLPDYIRNANPDAPAYPQLLMAAKQLYQATGTEPPPDISGLLADAPLPPPCRKPKTPGTAETQREEHR